MVLVFCSTAAFAQFQVTLKVVDTQNGALTNKVNDNNETNVFCWAGNDDTSLSNVGGDWWYAMYSGEARCPDGTLIKDAGVWAWQCTFNNVAPGEYRWDPKMKTLGWNSINSLYTYNSSSADLHFTVGSDGSVTGHTTLELPLVSTALADFTAPELTVSSRDKIIYLENLEDNTTISVYDLSGGHIKALKSSGSKAEVSVNTPGIYLVITDHHSAKVMVR